MTFTVHPQPTAHATRVPTAYLTGLPAARSCRHCGKTPIDRSAAASPQLLPAFPGDPPRLAVAGGRPQPSAARSISAPPSSSLLPSLRQNHITRIKIDRPLPHHLSCCPPAPVSPSSRRRPASTSTAQPPSPRHIELRYRFRLPCPGSAPSSCRVGIRHYGVPFSFGSWTDRGYSGFVRGEGGGRCGWNQLQGRSLWVRAGAQKMQGKC